MADSRRRSDGTSDPVRIMLLGGFSVSVGSRTVGERGWRLRKAAALVKLLALAPQHRMHREQVMDRLWPGSSRRAAANSLHQVLRAARQAIEPGAARYLSFQGEQLALCPEDPLWVDVEAFEKAVSMARRLAEPGAYEAALDLYPGDLLPEDRYEEWTEARREELRRVHLDMLLGLARAHEERDDYEPAIDALRRAVILEPTGEEANVGLMRLYALTGRRGAALGQYGRFLETLRRNLAAEPDAKSRRLYKEILAGDFPQTQGARPPRQPAHFPRHNLPARRTSFVGRERELTKVKRALSMTRLLTLTGAGGSGKTRLALEVASNLAEAYPDGAWLVELAPLSEGDLAPRAVASSLGIREQPDRPLTDTLIEYLRGKEALLLLDNCEHLVGAAAGLVDALLSSCSRLRVLATSRETLGVGGEINWPVPPLSLPGPERALTVEELGEYEAARLFIDRAMYHPSAFVLTRRNAKAVAEICRQLDGILLAIELAATRVGALAVEQISQRLSDSLKLLTGGSRTAQPRQRTMRGSLDWSYELLSERSGGCSDAFRSSRAAGPSKLPRRRGQTMTPGRSWISSVV